MDIQDKLTGLKTIDLTWIPWLLAAWSTGGLVLALQRALWLIGTSSWFNDLRARIRFGACRWAGRRSWSAG